MTPTYEQARDALTTQLSEAAVAHCERVAHTAAALAQVYGVDVERAALAGLLHDWHREKDAASLVDAAESRDIEIVPEARSVPYLLHAQTGAAELAQAFPGIDEQVVSAVAAHTVGSANMSDLDMVVWIADMLEPARDFDGVDDLREIVGTLSLDELFARCYQHSVAHLVASRKRIHPDTVAVWNALVAQVKR